MSHFVFWDTETTGLTKAFNVPVEFGVVVTDLNLQPIHDCNITCRPPRFALPHPWVLLCTNQSFSELISRPLSNYQGTCQFAQEIAAVTPACFVGYNCVRYDHGVIQYNFYRNLHDPYLLLRGGNRRIDLLPVMRLAHALGVGGLTMPIGDNGRATFKLDRLAPANGFTEPDAHTAIVDARATHHLARLLARNAPDVWHHAVNLWSRKDAVRALVSAGDVFVHFPPWPKPHFKALLPIGPAQLAGDFVCLDLAIDPATYAGLSAKQLREHIAKGSKPRAICKIRINSAPIVFERNDPLVRDRVAIDPTRAKRLRRDLDLHNRVLEAVDLDYQKRHDDFSASELPEQQLYSRGFFSDRDIGTMGRFHLAAPCKKLQVASAFTDDRLRYFAERVLYEEAPSTLPRGIHDRIDAERKARLLSNAECSWTTVPQALADIAEYGVNVLDDYREYLQRYA